METQQNENKQAKTPNPVASECERLDRFARECLGGNLRKEEAMETSKRLLELAEAGDCQFSRRCKSAHPECSVNAEAHPSAGYRLMWVKDTGVTNKDDFGIITTVGSVRYADD